ncbi:unnamed protein product [Candidula unifasciata]|uniref:G-protein coupled receptors family 1 profile domain-containing protein n=1 Tax=Candidula unifasciata TaxID=100452 RepID=A0A8S3YPT4_9EUPU|nr:unnamed protein product [Candidula unifasciata]
MATNGSFTCAMRVFFGFRTLYLTIPFVAIAVCKNVLIVFTAKRTNFIETRTKILVISMVFTEVILSVSYVCFGESDNLLTTLGITKPEYFESFLLGAWYSSVVLYLAHSGIIALERYINIAHPFYYQSVMINRSIYFIILCLWTFGLSYMIVPLLVYTKVHYHKSCILLHPPLEYYCIGAFVYVISCVAVMVSNFKVAFLAFRMRKASLARRIPSSRVGSNVAFRENFLAAVRSVKFFSAMFGMYFICTSPSVLCAGLNIVFPVPTPVYVFSIYLIPFNSILTFTLLFFMNNKFSQAVMRTFSDIKARLCKG